jgi:hypothetical protein
MPVAESAAATSGNATAAAVRARRRRPSRDIHQSFRQRRESRDERISVVID